MTRHKLHAAGLALLLAARGFADPTNTPVIPHLPVLSMYPSGVLRTPTNFWTTNSPGIFNALYPYLLELNQDVSEIICDTYVPDALDGYLTIPQALANFQTLSGIHPAGNVSVEPSFTWLYGGDLQTVLGSADTALSILAAQVSQVETTAPPEAVCLQLTNAADIRVAFTPTTYSPAGPTTEDHLRAIDSMLALLAAVNTNIPAVATLSSIEITGSDMAMEGTSEPYTLTATYSDSSTSNVTTTVGTEWSFIGARPPGTYLQTNVLVVGPLYADTTVVIRAQHSYLGAVRSDTHSVGLQDTNPPSLYALHIYGTNAVGENQSSIYAAWAQYDNDTWYNVTTNATWGFSGSVPSGTAWTGATLHVGEVLSNTALRITASYSDGVGLKGTTNLVTVVNTSRWFVISTAYTGVYNYGTLRIASWSNARMDGSPIYATTKADFSVQGTNTLNELNNANYSGETWWYAWLDTDTNNALNGMLQYSGYTLPQLRTDEPAARAAGQTSTSGVQITSARDCLISFALTDAAPAKTARQETFWAVKHVKISEHAGDKLIFSTRLTNRNYICEQDFEYSQNFNGTNRLVSGREYIMRSYGIATDGSEINVYYHGLFTAP